MTATVDEATLQRIRAEIEPLVDAYLKAHPEIVEQFADAFAAASPAPVVEAVPVDSEGQQEDDDDLSGAFAALFDDSDFFDESEEEELVDEIANSVIEDIFSDASDEDLGLADLFAEEEEEDEEEEEEAGEPLSSGAIDSMLQDDLDEEEIERLLEAGAVMEYEDE